VTECIAATCSRELRDPSQAPSPQQICDSCIHKIKGWLRSMPNQMIVLRRGSTQRETTGGIGRSGTKTPPLPGRPDTLNLCGPWAPGTVRDDRGDQVDGPVIAETLYRWVHVTYEKRRLNGPDSLTEEALAAWLVKHVDWAARQDFAGLLRDELFALMRAIWAITLLEPKTHAVSRPCPRCEHMTMTHTDHDLYTRCSNCGTSFTSQELGDDAIRRIPDVLAAA
jgi:ribosomal protein S27E